MKIPEDPATLVKIPLRWSDGRRFMRCLASIFLAVLACIVIPAPLLWIDAVYYLIGIGASGIAAILIVKRRLENDEKHSIRRQGPFIEIDTTHIRFPPGHHPAELAIARTSITRWRLPSRYSATNKTSTPPYAYVMLKGDGHHITLSGCDFIHNMEPFPLITREEFIARTQGSTFIAVDPEALIRGYQFMLKNAPVQQKSTPPKPQPQTTSLMQWGLSAEENRKLIEAGADVHAIDADGLNALAHQAVPPRNYIGYCMPDLTALQVLLDAGISRPDPATAQQWKARTSQHVTSALENSEATAFGEWLDRITLS
jgi:hypothetical protein